jgi:hypothetical protein
MREFSFIEQAYGISVWEREVDEHLTTVPVAWLRAGRQLWLRG